jgi:hypothetical protein
MQVNEISRQQFSKFASPGFQRRIVLTERGLVIGAGTLLAKLDGKALPIEAQERIWTLLGLQRVSSPTRQDSRPAPP